MPSTICGLQLPSICENHDIGTIMADSCLNTESSQISPSYPGLLQPVCVEVHSQAYAAAIRCVEVLTHGFIIHVCCNQFAWMFHSQTFAAVILCVEVLTQVP